ncbi:MAG: hypothetical protein WC779_03755 [Candidatus Omnitrophota bacterium]|jgi:hypothetical protein
MLRKEALLKQLDLLTALIKKAAPLLNKHITSSLSFSKLTNDERTAIVERFQDISVTQAKHVEILDQIRSEVLKGKKDVY